MLHERQSHHHMQLSEEDVQCVARLYDLRIEKQDLQEIVSRLNALLDEVVKLNDLELSSVEPIPVFLPSEDY